MKGILNRIKSKYNKLPVQVKASIWFFVCSIFQRGISVLVTPVFTRLMTTEQYGQFNVFNSWLDILGVFISLRIYYGCYSQGIVKFDERKDEFTSSLQGLSFTMSAIWLILLVCFQNLLFGFTSLSKIEIVLLVLMTWTAAIYNYWATYQRTQFLYKKLVLLTVIVSVVKPLFGILLVSLSEDKAIARLIGIAVVEVIAYIGLFISQVKKGRKFFDKDNWKYALTFAIPLIPHYLSQTILNSSDKIMIERMIGEGAAGIYSLGYSIAFIMLLVNTALLQTIEPWLYKKIKQNETEKIGSIAYICLILVGICNLVLIGLSPELVKIFAPESYYEAIWVIPPVAMSVFMIFMYSLFADFEFYFEKTALITLSTTLSAVLNIVLNYIFIKQFGYIAAAYTTLICYGFYSLFHYLMMKYVVKTCLGNLRIYDGKIILLIAAVFMSVGFLLMVLYENPIIRYLVLVCIIIILSVYFSKRASILLSLRKGDK